MVLNRLRKPPRLQSTQCDGTPLLSFPLEWVTGFYELHYYIVIRGLPYYHNVLLLQFTRILPSPSDLKLGKRNMRSFSTSRAVSKALTWNNIGTTQNLQWAQAGVESRVDYNPSLAKAAVGASIMFVAPFCSISMSIFQVLHSTIWADLVLMWWRGDPHPSSKADGIREPIHASGIITSASGARLTSFHSYLTGLVIFSKAKYAKWFQGQQTLHPDAGSASPQITWRLGPQSRPQWYDLHTKQWVFGQYFPDDNKWRALYNGQWHEFQPWQELRDEFGFSWLLKLNDIWKVWSLAATPRGDHQTKPFSRI